MKACRNNPNIIKFIDTFRTDRSVLIVMEYCDEGTLKDYVKKKISKRLTEDKATFFLKQIINGFKGLHEKRIIHRDFKS
jgi:serine/threonine-protein kinase ULK2